MSRRIAGIHHVTAIASDPQRNLDFYRDVLGLRLVKLTVNFDDSGTYHFYFGDEVGQPGTILTFFPWPGARRGRRGNGQVAVTSFSIPEGALGYWDERLRRYGVSVGEFGRRFDEEALVFLDPDGMQLELVAHRAAGGETSWKGPVPAQYAVQGFHGVTMWEENSAGTEPDRSTGQQGSSSLMSRLKRALVERTPRFARFLETLLFSSLNTQYSFRDRGSFKKLKR